MKLGGFGQWAYGIVFLFLKISKMITHCLAIQIKRIQRLYYPVFLKKILDFFNFIAIHFPILYILYR